MSHSRSRSAALGPDGCKVRCPSCGTRVRTSTAPVAGLLTWSLCILLCLIGCFLGCCLIPFFVEGCQDIEHRCPRCDAYVGKYSRCG